MPRTRFIFKTTRELPTRNLEIGEVGGHTVHLRHKGPWLSASATSAIMDQVQRAKSMLSVAIAAMYSGMMRKTSSNGMAGPAIERARTYFLIPDSGPTDLQCMTITSVLELTHNGLNSDVTLKLGGDGCNGYVRRHRVSAGTPGSYTTGNGIHWTSEGHAIHISKKEMLRSADLGVITLIHEATHKYANTLDHRDAGYRREDDRDWKAPGLTVDQALNNADSYAYFAFRLGLDYGC